jgi:hypothetical protein
MALSCKSPVVSPPVYLEGGRVNAYERSENIIIILKVSGYCQDGERVGNEATVSTRLAAGDGLVTKQLVFGVTRSEFVGTAVRVMKPFDPPPRIASRRSRRSNRWALERSRSNKPLLPTGLGPLTSTPDLLNRPAAE